VTLRTRVWWGGLGAAAILGAGSLGSRAAGTSAPPPAEAPFEVTADTLNYDRSRDEVEAIGRVTIRRGTDELRADHVRFHQASGQATATGAVRLTRAGEVWTGERLQYNFRTGVGQAENMRFDGRPFRLLSSRRAEKKAGNVYRIEEGRVTTCTNAPERCHYSVSARQVEVVPGESVTARGAVWRFGPVPVMYVPYWHRDLSGDFGYRVHPGYDSRMGAFLLNSYRYRINPLVGGTTHLDLRSKRGVGVGQDFRWHEPPGWLQGHGDLTLYYAADAEPNDPDDTPEEDIDRDRYRIRLREDYWLGPADQVLLQANYLSDRDVLEDFFEKEYRGGAEPENYATYGHLGEGYGAGVRLRARLNDFYTSVERLPEAYLELYRRPLADGALYYESETAAAFLRQTWADDPPEQDEPSTFRLDSRHMAYRPERLWGFLNLVPRGGVRGTYYSETQRQVVETEVVTVTRTNFVAAGDGTLTPVVQTGSQTNRVERRLETGAELRGLIELGLETSFKAFKTWPGWDAEYRHIVEPYADYTFVPEPNLTPDRLHPFDSVDELDEKNQVKLGVRNRLQSRQEGAVGTLADVDLYTLCQFHRPAGEDLIERLYTDIELRPLAGVRLDADGVWNVADSTLERFNTRVAWTASEALRLAVEHRYRHEDSNLAIGDVTLWPNRQWTYNVSTRYEFEDRRLEEQGGYVQRNLDCLSVRCGMNFMPGYTRSDGSEQKDEYRVILAFWLSAFPESGISTQHLK